MTTGSEAGETNTRSIRMYQLGGTNVVTNVFDQCQFVVAREELDLQRTNKKVGFDNPKDTVCVCNTNVCPQPRPEASSVSKSNCDRNLML